MQTHNSAPCKPHPPVAHPVRRWLRELLGISTVEFALTFPILLLLAFGLIETGYMYFAAASMDKAAQAGVRVAVTGTGSDDGTRQNLIENKILNTVSTFNNKGAIAMEIHSFSQSAPAAVADNAGGPCDIVEVKVDYTYAPLTPIIGSLFGSSITVHGIGRMVNEPWMVCK